MKPPFQQLETAAVSAPSKEGQSPGEPGKAIVSLENGSPQGDFITAPSKPLKLEAGTCLRPGTIIWPNNGREAARLGYKNHLIFRRKPREEALEVRDNIYEAKPELLFPLSR